MHPVKDKILVIIVAYNEEGRVGPVVRSVCSCLPDATVLVVNDCSKDGTRQEALAAGALVVSHVVNLGYGAALETGYLYAIKGGFDAVVQMDGDGQHLAEEAPKLLKPVLENCADLVIGSRYVAGGCGLDTGFVRRIGRKLFAAIFRIVTGKDIKDPTSGFQCLSRKSLELYTKLYFPGDYPDVDVLILNHYAGLRVEEVPVRMAHRTAGSSIHSGLRPFYYVMKMLLSILIVVLEYRKRKIDVS